MTPKLHLFEEDQDHHEEFRDAENPAGEAGIGRRLIVVRRSRVLAMEEVFEVSVVDEEDSNVNAMASATSEATAPAADDKAALRTLKCRRCGSLQQFEVAAVEDDTADDDSLEKRQVRYFFNRILSEFLADS